MASLAWWCNGSFKGTRHPDRSEVCYLRATDVHTGEHRYRALYVQRIRGDAKLATGTVCISLARSGVQALPSMHGTIAVLQVTCCGHFLLDSSPAAADTHPAAHLDMAGLTAGCNIKWLPALTVLLVHVGSWLFSLRMYSSCW